MMKKLSLALLVSAIALMLCVGSVFAKYEEIGPIASQAGTASMNVPPNFVCITENFTSWLHVLITTKVFEWEWITSDGSMQVQTLGDSRVNFQSYVTIQTYNLSLTWKPQGTTPIATVTGGIGYSFIQIHIVGTSTWELSMTTNYIPSSYFGSITQIALNATEGSNTNISNIGLQI